MRTMRADVVYDSNNGVLAVKPTQTGRLRHLVSKTTEEHERVWTFTDPHTYVDAKGNARISHHVRGVSSGTWKQGHDLLEYWEKKCGLVVAHAGFFVPFSNGERRYGQDRAGNPICDYNDDELELLRLDNLPSDAEISRAIAVAFAENETATR